ncbi:uncharacterized protein LOC127734182 isoform X2 [Mytilus californianus]|uniref:uncharacterized protein LOC127734182 isoform X2 n=1 Tax=Mytilus californianus TaxID=6549 RepID=UPI002246EF47|nr:uncharacterized protein LOC127734182 isoform X2 [Mytilus californianus]
MELCVWLLKVFYILTLTTQRVYTLCPPNGISNSEACYWIVDIGTEYEVINACKANNGTLASIPNRNVSDFITSSFDSLFINTNIKLYGSVNGYFIGVNDKLTENVFMNYEDELQNWTNWDNGKPDGNTLQNCVKLFPYFVYKWDDDDCTVEAPGLCYFKFPKDTSTVSMETTADTTSTERTTNLITTQLLATTSQKLISTISDYTTETRTTKMIGTTSETITSEIVGTTYSENTTEECICVCYATNQPIDRSELQAKIDKLVKELTIPKKETSRNKRKLISAPDNRTSAKSIGYVGATVLILIGGLIIGMDALNICKNVSSK